MYTQKRSRYFVTGAIIFLFSFLNAKGQFVQGIVSPKIEAGTTLYIYSGELIDDLLHHAAVKDSITFVNGKHSIEIGTAPPWFVPEHLKLDYDIFILKAVTLSRNWIEVIVNRTTGKTAWISRADVEYKDFSEFLLSVFSVESFGTAKNPIRNKPLDNGTIVVDPGKNSMRTIAVKGEWLKVSFETEKPGSIPKLGWIRWKKGNQLLITWSLLS